MFLLQVNGHGDTWRHYAGTFGGAGEEARVLILHVPEAQHEVLSDFLVVRLEEPKNLLLITDTGLRD